MFLKIILIILGVIIMKKFLNWIKDVFISHSKLNNEIKNLSNDHKNIEKLLGDDGILAKEYKDIKDLLSENGKLRINVDKILKMKEIEEAVKKEVDRQNIPIENSINNIILLTEKYAKKETEITILERDNKNLRDKIINLEKEIEELKSKNISIKDVYIDLKFEQEDNNKLYEKLLKDSDLIKEEIIDMFKNNDICADKNGNAIFPIKNDTGQVIGAFELNLTDKDKIEKPKFWKQGDLNKAEYLSNKVFKSVENMRKKYENIEKDYEQEL